MNTFDEKLNKATAETLTTGRMVGGIVSHKLAQYGLTLNDAQLHALEEHLEAGFVENLRFELTDEQIESLQSSGETLPEKLQVSIDESDIADLETRIDRGIYEVVMAAAKSIATHLADDWTQHYSSVLAERETELRQFRSEFDSIWAETLERLELFYDLCMTIGSDFNSEHRPTAAATNDHVFEALVHLHGRSCRVAAEVAALLKAGFADGAMARWRTLHELTVIGLFLAHSPTEISERYLLHSAITDLKEARSYQEHCALLGYEPLDATELDTLRQRYDEVCKRYGSQFANDYGWAPKELNNGKRGPTFADIERSVSMQHLRPFYLAANASLHAGSKGLKYALGLPLDSTFDLVLTGPSIYGVAEPAQNAAYSLNLMTGTLLLSCPSLGTLSTVLALGQLLDQLVLDFIEVEHKLDGSGS